MSVFESQGQSFVVRQKKKQLLCLVQLQMKILTESHCVWVKTVWMGGFKPRDPGSASNNPVICPERLGGNWMSGRGVGLYRRTQGVCECRTLMLCYCEGRRHTLEMSFCCSVGFKDSWRRCLPCQSGMRDIIGIPVVPNALAVNQLDSPPPSAHCRLIACELALRLEKCLYEHVSCQHNVQFFYFFYFHIQSSHETLF